MRNTLRMYNSTCVQSCLLCRKMQQLKSCYVIHFKLEYLKTVIKQHKGASEAIDYLELSDTNISICVILSHMLRMLLKYLQRNCE